MNCKIKQLPEDFVVEEIPAAKDGEGTYSYYWLEKKGYNTLRAIKIIGDKLRVNIKGFGWAGNKDKNAITKQMISIQNTDRKFVERLKLTDISLTYHGSGKERIYIGNLLGNKFTIILRNLSSSDYEAITKNFVLIKQNDSLIPNYFDEQRFGQENILVGKAILSRDFKTAANTLYREEVQNPVQALLKIHGSVLSMYIHAYQSLLFNETLAEYIHGYTKNYSAVSYSQGQLFFPRIKIPDTGMPIIGFGTETDYGKIGTIAAGVLKKHNITTRDFIIKQLPKISIEGDSRNAFVTAENLELSELQADELNEGMKRCTVTFSLGKGSYATIVIKNLTMPL